MQSVVYVTSYEIECIWHNLAKISSDKNASVFVFFFYLFFFCEYFFFRFANLWVIHRDKQYLACTPCRFVSICLIDFNAMFRLLPFSAHTILILSSTAHNLSVCVCEKKNIVKLFSLQIFTQNHPYMTLMRCWMCFMVLIVLHLYFGF